MIEAIASSLRETALGSPTAELVSKPDDAPLRAAEMSPAASSSGPFYSPVVRLDPEAQRTVITFRDINTGDVTIQYPSERQLEAYRASIRQRRVQEDAATLERIFGDRAGRGAPAEPGQHGAGREGAAYAAAMARPGEGASEPAARAAEAPARYAGVRLRA